MDILPLNMYMLSCQWAQPFWQARIEDLCVHVRAVWLVWVVELVTVHQSNLFT